MGLGDKDFLAHAAAHPALGLAQLLLRDQKGGGATGAVGGQVHCGFLKTGWKAQRQSYSAAVISIQPSWASDTSSWQ
jgi:hypothetical protein